MILALAGDHFRSILPPKTTLKANKREQQKPSFYTIKVMVSRVGGPRCVPKPTKKGSPEKKRFLERFFTIFVSFWTSFFTQKSLQNRVKNSARKKTRNCFSYLRRPGDPPPLLNLRRQAGTEKRRRGRAASQTWLKKKSCETPATTQTKLAWISTGSSGERNKSIENND